MLNGFTLKMVQHIKGDQMTSLTNIFEDPQFHQYFRHIFSQQLEKEGLDVEHFLELFGL
jgi:hypothetical protein